jgi:anti-sigma factor RsiW
VVELITDYLEGALAPDTADRVSAHLSDCGGCSAYVHQMRATASVLRGLELSGLPEGACEELVAAFRDWPDARLG